MMERIDHSNYEAWLLDRFEGNLSIEQLRMLDAFLLRYPELLVSDEDLPSFGLEPSSLRPSDRAELKRNLPPEGLVNEGNVEDHLIARAEGDLGPEQQQALRTFLAENTAHQRSAKLIALSRIEPSAHELLNKEHLLRSLPPSGILGSHDLDDQLIARMEADLDQEQEAALSEAMRQRPELELAYKRYQLTRIQPERLVYEPKAELKRTALIIPIGASVRNWTFQWRAAAAITVLLSMAFWALQRGGHEKVITAEKQGAEAATLGDTQSNGPKLVPDGTIGSELSDRELIPSTKGSDLAEGGVKNPDSRSSATEESRSKEGKVRVPADERGTLDYPQHIAARQSVLDRSALPKNELRVLPGTAVEEGSAIASKELPGVAERDGIPLAAFVGTKLREGLLGSSTEDPRPLDADDAIAALDKGLKALGGNAVGLELERGSSGRVKGFDLRLGHNFAISAGR